VALILVPAGSSQASSWTFNPGPLAPDQSAFEITETRLFGASSRVEYLVFDPARDALVVRTCVEFGLAPCTEDVLKNSAMGAPSVGKPPHLRFQLTMGSCADPASDQGWCIEEFRVQKVSSPSVPARLVRSVAGTTTSAIAELGIPAGSTMPLYAGGTGSGFEGLSFAVFASAEMQNLPIPGQQQIRMRATGFNLQVVPYVLNPDRKFGGFSAGPESLPGLTVPAAPPGGCAWADMSGCGEIVEFPEDIRLGVSIRTTLPIREFFNGRLQNAALEVSRVGSVTRLSIDAEPVVVPRVASVYPADSGLAEKADLRPGFHSVDAFGGRGFQVIEAMRELLSDAAVASSSYWRLTSIGIAEQPNCFKDTPMAGLLVTNATVYEGMDPPRFAGGFLDYKVAGMHYLEDRKTEFLGNYELILRSEVARCLYKYTNAPISAKVTVVGAAGEEKVSTSTVREENGFLTLRARGFTFSENTVRVQISQQGKTITGPVVSPGQAAKPAPQTFVANVPAFAASKSTLTSVQKAAIRKLLGKSPKTVRCFGFFDDTKLLALTRARAESSCSYAKSLFPKAKVSSSVVRLLGTKQAGRVQVVRG
jgi:hypothetical protein